MRDLRKGAESEGHHPAIAHEIVGVMLRYFHVFPLKKTANGLSDVDTCTLTLQIKCHFRSGRQDVRRL